MATKERTTTPIKGKKVSEIKSNLLRPSTTSHFYVEIGLPAGSIRNALKNVLGTVAVEQNQLNLLCSEAVLPGSQLATTEVMNNITGVTERHAYRRIYDETIDLTFYVDAKNYLPIMFFETWMSEIVNEDQNEALDDDYNYRNKYPNDYVAQGLKVIKFEKDFQDQNIDITGVTSPFQPSGKSSRKIRNGSGTSLEYQFVRSFPRSITSMPVSYDGSNLLKCSVQMTYLRYVVHRFIGGNFPGSSYTPFTQSTFNFPGGFGNQGLPSKGKIASGMMMNRGILGSNIQQALRRQGLPANTTKVRFWGKGSNMRVEAL